MPTLRLNSIPYFKDNKALQELNRLVEARSNLMPHELAVAVGCSVQEAMGVLLLLVAHSLAEAVILVYHRSDPADPPAPFLSRSLYEGLPKPPLLCDICGNEISSDHDLTYDFSFKLTTDIHFTS